MRQEPGRFEFNVSQARQFLPGLIRDLERHPDRVFRILSRKRLVAELKAPALVAKKGEAARALLALAGRKRARGRMKVSEDVDRHLY
ncbi:MAG: hypothetical protein HY748_05290 [Elusimicrobia bacterium]|nr:hypothetical protein [Elusimicrobiota bacterium]